MSETRTGRPTLATLLERLEARIPSTEDLGAATLRIADAACAVRLGGTLAQWAPVRRAVAQGAIAAPGARLGDTHGTVSAAGAAGALAACCRLTEVDDIELSSCTTPGAVVVPAALAAYAACRDGAPGRNARTCTVPAAVAHGYEVVVGAAALLGGAFAPGHGLWPTRAVAAIGAAATAAHVVGEAPSAHVDAVGLAASATVIGTFPEPGRAWSLGMAVAVGVSAALAAAAGVRASAEMLERWPAATALASVGSVASVASVASVGRVADALATQTSAVRRSCCKPYAGARQVLAASATLRSLVEAGDVDPGDVASVRLRVPGVHARMVDRPALAVRLDTLASAQYQLALALDAPGTLDALDHPLPPPGAVASRMSMIEVADAPGRRAGAPLDDAFPGSWMAELELVARDGRRREILARSVPGEENVTWAEVESKARRLATANRIDPAETARLIELARHEDWLGLLGALLDTTVAEQRDTELENRKAQVSR